jgi:hypothetical protein
MVQAIYQKRLMKENANKVYEKWKINENEKTGIN